MVDLFVPSNPPEGNAVAGEPARKCTHKHHRQPNACMYSPTIMNAIRLLFGKDPK